MLAGCASSKWTKVGINEHGTYYIDKTYIRKNNYGKVITIEMLDYKDSREIDDKTFNSASVQYEYDCATEKRRLKYVTAHSGNMGKGETVKHIVNTFTKEWASVTSGKFEESILLSVCYKAQENNSAERDRLNKLLLWSIYLHHH